MIEVARLYRLEGERPLKAFADVIIGEVLVKGVRIIQGNNGLFVTMPKSQGKDGKFAPSAFIDFVFESLRNDVNSVGFFDFAGPMKKGGMVTLVGFGTFYVGKRAARNGRNPRTGASIKIKAARVPKFRAGKALKDALN